MTFGVFLLCILAALIVGGAGGYSWEAGRAAEAENARLKVQAELDATAAKLKVEAENHLSDMQSAFAAGEANKAPAARKATDRAAADVQRYASVFQNPACTLPDTSLALLRATIQGVRSGIVLPPDESGNSPRELPPSAPPVVGKPPAATSRNSGTSGTRTIPGGPTAPPKPVPIGKVAP